MRILSRIRKALVGHTGRIGLRLVVYAMACLAVLLYLISLIGNIHFLEKTHSYKAQLSDVTGLLDNDSVKIAGVEVGKVTSIKLDHGHAVVTFQVKSNVKLRKGTQVAVRWRNLLGQKYLYLYPPTSGPALKGGSTLSSCRNAHSGGRCTNEVSSAEIGQFLNTVGPVLQAIDPEKANQFVDALNQALDGNDVRVRDLLTNASKIANTVGGLDTDVGTVIDNLHTVVGSLASRNQDLVATIENLRNLSGTLADNSNTITSLLDDFTTLNQQVQSLLNKNEGDFTQAITNLQTIVNTLAKHHSDLDAGLSTLPQGALGYFRISRSGQWFQVRSIVTCIAGDSPKGALVSAPCTMADLLSSALPSSSAGAAAKSSGSSDSIGLGQVVGAVAGGAR
ncbi:MAG TPA: MlaD family protein [Acidimicrobiales bacterium]|nr:MlaD family protein [Acidimicrobiales bacterium]